LQKNLGKETLWKRVKLLVRGLLLYNTVYWQRASDGLKPPKLTHAERKLYEPPRNLEVIKPRLNPKARLLRRQMARITQNSVAQANDGEVPAGEPLGPETLMRRRKRKRHRKNLIKSFAPAPSGSSFFSRLIGR
jgi:hypothetical protein